MTKAMMEELRAVPPVGDERDAMETETNGDQRDGDEEPTGEKPKVLEEKEPGGRFKDRDITRAGQSAALPSVCKQSVNDIAPFRYQVARGIRLKDCRPDQQRRRGSSRLWR